MKLKELNNTVVHCKTEEEYDELMRIYDELYRQYLIYDLIYGTCTTKKNPFFHKITPTTMFTRTTKDQKLLIKAGFMNEDLSLTCKGRDAFINMQLDDKETMKSFVAKAKESLED